MSTVVGAVHPFGVKTVEAAEQPCSSRRGATFFVCGFIQKKGHTVVARGDRLSGNWLRVRKEYGSPSFVISDAYVPPRKRKQQTAVLKHFRIIKVTS